MKKAWSKVWKIHVDLEFTVNHDRWMAFALQGCFIVRYVMIVVQCSEALRIIIVFCTCLEFSVCKSNIMLILIAFLSSAQQFWLSNLSWDCAFGSSEKLFVSDVRQDRDINQTELILHPIPYTIFNANIFLNYNCIRSIYFPSQYFLFSQKILGTNDIIIILKTYNFSWGGVTLPNECFLNQNTSKIETTKASIQLIYFYFHMVKYSRCIHPWVPMHIHNMY